MTGGPVEMNCNVCRTASFFLDLSYSSYLVEDWLRFQFPSLRSGLCLQKAKHEERSLSADTLSRPGRLHFRHCKEAVMFTPEGLRAESFESDVLQRLFWFLLNIICDCR